jgi:phosphoribosylformylglycinamidine synthase subunit PurS
MYLAHVYVTLKQSVLDPQGTAVQKALAQHGFEEVKDVRIGKFMELKLDIQDRAVAEERVKAMCERLLANPVIETYRIEMTEVEA